MDLKINVLSIIKDHVTSFRDDDKRFIGWDIAVFGIAPFVLSLLLIVNCIHISIDFVNVIISALSIFVGLLFNIIVVLFDIVKTDKVRAVKRELVREVITNISFCILLSLFAIIGSLATQIDFSVTLKLASNFLTYLLISEFILTLFMILKRMYALFINEIDEIARKERGLDS